MADNKWSQVREGVTQNPSTMFSPTPSEQISGSTASYKSTSITADWVNTEVVIPAKQCAEALNKTSNQAAAAFIQKTLVDPAQTAAGLSSQKEVKQSPTALSRETIFAQHASDNNRVKPEEPEQQEQTTKGMGSPS